MDTALLSPALQALLETVPPAQGPVRGQTVSFVDGDTTLEGYLALPADAGGDPAPAVLVIHDWNGMSDHVRVRAEMLARLGYVALAADVYGVDVRPTSVEQAQQASGAFYGDVERFRSRVAANLARLLDEPRVDRARVGVMGYCFGGSGALELARSGADVAAVVSFHGSLATPEPATRGSIGASVLVLTGAEDPVVPKAAVEAFEDEMRDAEVADWQVVTYSHAMHAFAVPGADVPEMGVQYQPTADRRSWTAMQHFLAETLAA